MLVKTVSLHPLCERNRIFVPFYSCLILLFKMFPVFIERVFFNALYSKVGSVTSAQFHVIHERTKTVEENMQLSAKLLYN